MRAEVSIQYYHKLWPWTTRPGQSCPAAWADNRTATGQGSDTIAQRVLRAKSDRITLPARWCATLRTKRHVPPGRGASNSRSLGQEHSPVSQSEGQLTRHVDWQWCSSPGTRGAPTIRLRGVPGRRCNCPKVQLPEGAVARRRNCRRCNRPGSYSKPKGSAAHSTGSSALHVGQGYSASSTLDTTAPSRWSLRSISW